jgi:O-antigen ligase
MGAADVVAHIFAWLFVFAVPWQEMVFLPGLGTLSRVLGMGALGATALNVLLRGKVRTLTGFHWLVFAYLCWVLLSVSWAVAEPASVERKVKTYLQILVMVWVIWETTPTRSRLASLLQAYVLGAYVAAGSTIHNYAIGEALVKDVGRFAAEGFDANDLGMLLALALPMAWYLASNASNGLQRWLNRGYFVAGTLAILLTSSRGALLTTLVALSVVPFTLTQIRPGVKVAGLVIMLLAGAAAVRFVPAKSFHRLSTTTSEISEGTMTGRLSIWKSGLRAVPKRPLQGYGPAGWYLVAGDIGIKHRGPHNTYLSILVEEGMIGLLLYLAMFAVLLIRLRALPAFERRVGLTLLATLAIAITPLGWDTNKASWLVLALLAGWSGALASARWATTPIRPVRTALRRPGAAPTPAAIE